MPCWGLNGLAYYMFQSAPAPRGGRCQELDAQAADAFGFNPRPPRGAGDARRGKRLRWSGLVSIRARPEGRAMLSANWGYIIKLKVQSAPAPRGGRCFNRFREVSGPDWFQSAPAPRGGRCVAYLGVTRWQSCFNPRPPRGAGDAEVVGHAVQWHVVSIRARPEGRAMRQATDRRERSMLFQSAPAPRGGRGLKQH